MSCVANVPPSSILKFRAGHEFQLEFLADRAVIAAGFGKPPRGLALEFAFADIADVSTDHKSEEMLGVDAFGMPAESGATLRCKRSRPQWLLREQTFTFR